MGGVIKLNEKEKWAAYFSALLQHSGYQDASKFLHAIAYGTHRPIDDFPEGLVLNQANWKKMAQAIQDAQEEVKSLPKKPITKKPFKPTLAEDMHGDKLEEDV